MNSRLAAACAFASFVLPASVGAQPTVPRDRAPAVPASIRSYVEHLYSADARERAEAACQIGRRRSDAAAAIPILLSMLSDDVVVQAIDCDMNAWLRRQLPVSVAALTRALRGDADARVRIRAAWALGEIEDPSAVSGLVAALKDADAQIQDKAGWALGEIESASAVDGLVGALKDADAAVRRQAVWALGEIEDSRAVPALGALLRDADVTIRKQAAWALGEIEDSRALEALRAARYDVDVEVRLAVANAIRELRDK